MAAITRPVWLRETIDARAIFAQCVPSGRPETLSLRRSTRECTLPFRGGRRGEHAGECAAGSG